MFNIIAIIGPSGSGKDTILKRIVETNDVNKIIGYTTRPIREGEVNGVDYHFITPKDFAEKVLNGEMIEATSFNNWFYGTGLSHLSNEKVNIGVFNVEAAEIMQNYDTYVNFIPFYLKVSDKNRLLRQLNREGNPNVEEIVRRFLRDKLDFEDFERNTTLNYIELKNDNLEDFDKACQKIFKAISEVRQGQ